MVQNKKYKMTGRPRKYRQIKLPPVNQVYRPSGTKNIPEGDVILTLGEYEAIRLGDYELYNHEEGARCMGVSRSTFTRIIESAHRKIGAAFVEGKSIIIKGGNYNISRNIFECQDCGYHYSGDEHPEICPECKSERIICLGSNYGMCNRNRCLKGRNLADNDINR